MEAQLDHPAPLAVRPRLQLFTVFALVVIGGILLLLYDRLLLNFDFLNLLYASTGTLAVGVGLGLALGALALSKPGPGKAGRALIVGGMLALAAFPLVMPLMYGPYELGMQPAEGHQMVWLTEPQSRWASSLKSAQYAHEKTGCAHTLHGWDASGALVYGSSCGDLWRADPASGGTPEALSALSASLDASAVDRGSQHPGGSHLYPKTPAQLDPAGSWFITTERSVSPDGSWYAVVLRPFYGPTDVVLVSR